MSGFNPKNAANLLAVLILTLFTFLVFAQAEKKFTLDELDFPVVAKATSETGLPVYYRGEDRANHLGLYHPPLYIYALATQIKLFGFSENNIRAFGLACALITAFLALLLSQRLLPDKSQEVYRFVFLGVYLLNPYTIANATLPDIDSTILPPLITLFALLLLKNKSNLLLAGVFSLLLWAKLTTPLALIPFSLLYLKFNGVPIRKIAIRAIYIFGGGALFFLATYWIYCTAVGLPFSYTFRFLLHSFTKGSTSPGLESFILKVWENLGNTKYFFNKITTPFVFLALASITYFGVQRVRSLEAKNTRFLIFLCVGVTLFYSSLIAPFGGYFKYPFAVFQFGCLGVALLVVRSFEEFPSKLYFLFICLAAIVFASVQAVYWAGEPTFGLQLSANIASLIAVIAGSIAGLALNGYKFLNRGAAVLIITAFTAVVGTGFGIARYEAMAPFPTKYSYGQMGMNETVAYLRANLRDGEVIWSMKDIGFYSGNHYIENYEFFVDSGTRGKLSDLVKSGIRFFVATQGIGEDRVDAYPEAREALENCCRLEKNFGNFYIYVPK